MTSPNFILLTGFMDFAAMNQRLQGEMGTTWHENTEVHYVAWKTTNDYATRTLPGKDPYRPSAETIADIRGHEMHLKEKRDAIKQYPPYNVMPFELKLVDTANVLPAQLHIDLRRVEVVSGRMPSEMDFDALIDFTLDTKAHEVAVSRKIIGQTMQGYARLVLEDDDIRFRGVELRDVPLSESTVGHMGPGRAKALAFLFSLGDPFITALRFHVPKKDSTGREAKVPYVVLANGYHRAYALWQAGHRKIPCVFADISTQEITAFVPEPQGALASAASLDRPPQFRDFFDPKLTMKFVIPNRRRLFSLQWAGTIENLYMTANHPDGLAQFCQNTF